MQNRELKEGVIKADLKRMLTKISGAIGYKHDPKMRQELLGEIESDIVAVMSKHGYVAEAEDHEVGMAMGQLSAIHEAAGELEEKIGTEEKDLPGWIQAHITSAYEYLKQANDNFHELDESGPTHVLPGQLKGMGDVSLPSSDSVGSGDVPAGSEDICDTCDRPESECECNHDHAKESLILSFESFVNETSQTKSFQPVQPKEEALGEDDYEIGPANDPDEEMKEREKYRNKSRGVSALRDFNSF